MRFLLGRISRITIAGLALGALAGAILGIGLGLLHGAYALSRGGSQVGSFLGLPYQGDYVSTAMMIAAAFGLVVGAWVETRKSRPVR